ncbi:MAG: site-2 protease family protein [Candidatus Nanohaloarchaea archaeon]
MRFPDGRELRDLAAAWVVLSVAFGNLLGGISFRPVAISFGTVGLGFLLHELAHKVVAQRYGLWAEFRADYSMLFFAFALSFAGFIFAAPGAVYSRGERTGRQQMWISAAGPAVNIVLAAMFFFVPGEAGFYGFQINSWLALFNLIPFGGLDGESIYRYSKPVFAVLAVVSGVLVFVL